MFIVYFSLFLQLKTQPGFSVALLQLVANASVDPSIKQAGERHLFHPQKKGFLCVWP